MLETAAQELGTHSQAAWHQRFTDPAQPATDQSGEIPERLIQAALKAVRRVPWHSTLAILHLGRWLTEPNPLAVFEPAPHRATLTASALLKLDRRTRMLYRGKRLFINGELAEVPLNMTFKLLADEREVLLTKAQWQRLSQDSRHCLQDWIEAGWVHQHNPA
jgi:50S ribosomal protein L16 3-hydroxylase